MDQVTMASALDDLDEPSSPSPRAQLDIEFKLINDNIRAYENAYRKAKFRSQSTRFITVCLFIFGISAPSIFAANADLNSLIPLGYGALVLSGAMMMADRYFLITPMRLNFLRAIVELRFIRRRLEIEMSRVDVSKFHASSYDIESIFSILIDIEEKRAEILNVETTAWLTGYRSAMDELGTKLPPSGGTKS